MVEVQRQTRTYLSSTSWSVGLLSDGTSGCDALHRKPFLRMSKFLLTKVRVMTQTMT